MVASVGGCAPFRDSGDGSGPGMRPRIGSRGWPGPEPPPVPGPPAPGMESFRGSDFGPGFRHRGSGSGAGQGRDRPARLDGLDGECAGSIGGSRRPSAGRQGQARRAHGVRPPLTASRRAPRGRGMSQHTPSSRPSRAVHRTLPRGRTGLVALEVALSLAGAAALLSFPRGLAHLRDHLVRASDNSALRLSEASGRTLGNRRQHLEAAYAQRFRRSRRRLRCPPPEALVSRQRSSIPPTGSAALCTVCCVRKDQPDHSPKEKPRTCPGRKRRRECDRPGAGAEERSSARAVPAIRGRVRSWRPRVSSGA